MKAQISQAVREVYRDYRIRHKGERGVLNKFRAQMKIWVGEMQLNYLIQKYDGQIMPVQKQSLDKTPQFAEIEPAEPVLKQPAAYIKTEPNQQQATNFRKALSRPLVRRNPFKLKTGQEIPISKQDRAVSNPPFKHMPTKCYAPPLFPKHNEPKKQLQAKQKSLESGRFGQLHRARSHFEGRNEKSVKDVSFDIINTRNNK